MPMYGYGNEMMFGQQRNLRRYAGPGQMMQAQINAQQRQIAIQQQQIAMQQAALRRQQPTSILGAVGQALTGGLLGGAMPVAPVLPPPRPMMPPPPRAYGPRYGRW